MAEESEMKGVGLRATCKARQMVCLSLASVSAAGGRREADYISGWSGVWVAECLDNFLFRWAGVRRMCLGNAEVFA